LPRGVNGNVVVSAEKFIKNHGRAELINVAKLSLKNI